MADYPDMVPEDDPRIELIGGWVANAYGHRLPFKSASYATQRGRITMARQLLAALDAWEAERENAFLADLQSELEELEATDPEVKAAAESYDAMVQRVTRPPFREPAAAMCDELGHEVIEACFRCGREAHEIYGGES